MFEHLKFIPVEHQVALMTAVRNHNMGTGINPALLGKLYKVALDGIGPKQDKEADVYTSVLATDTVILSTATDAKTGIYVQLAANRKNLQATPLLTLGQKWAMEGHNPVQGNSATVYW